jgi:hypothetical protein
MRARVASVARGIAAMINGKRAPGLLNPEIYCVLLLERVRAAQPYGARVEVWFPDEARFGQKNGLTRVWGQTGSRPAAPKDLGYASA